MMHVRKFRKFARQDSISCVRILSSLPLSLCYVRCSSGFGVLVVVFEGATGGPGNPHTPTLVIAPHQINGVWCVGNEDSITSISSQIGGHLSCCLVS